VTGGATSLRCFHDDGEDWVMEIASDRWGGGWVEAVVLCRGEHRPYATKNELAESIQAALDSNFDGLPAGQADANRVLGAVSSQLMRERLGFR
jgi:hypothetical protein